MCNVIILIGIDEAFLKVSQDLIKLYETSPNSGLQTIDLAESSQQGAQPSSPGSTVHLQGQQNHVIDTQDKCSC